MQHHHRRLVAVLALCPALIGFTAYNTPTTPPMTKSVAEEKPAKDKSIIRGKPGPSACNDVLITIHNGDTCGFIVSKYFDGKIELFDQCNPNMTCKELKTGMKIRGFKK